MELIGVLCNIQKLKVFILRGCEILSMLGTLAEISRRLSPPEFQTQVSPLFLQEFLYMQARVSSWDFKQIGSIWMISTQLSHPCSDEAKVQNRVRAKSKPAWWMKQVREWMNLLIKMLYSYIACVSMCECVYWKCLSLIAVGSLCNIVQRNFIPLPSPKRSHFQILTSKALS